MASGDLVGKLFSPGDSRDGIRQKRSRSRKERPANEITEEEVRTVFDAIRGAEQYVRLRQLADLVPSMNPFKLNVILRYLERSGTILIDGDGHIIWTRGEKSEHLTLADVAEFSQELKDYLKNNDN